MNPQCRENNDSLFQVEHTWDRQTDVTTVTRGSHRHKEESLTLQDEAEGASQHTDILAMVGSSEQVEGAQLVMYL